MPPAVLHVVTRDGLAVEAPVWVRTGRRLAFGRVVAFPSSGLIRVRLGDREGRRRVHTMAVPRDVYPATGIPDAA